MCFHFIVWLCSTQVPGAHGSQKEVSGHQQVLQVNLGPLEEEQALLQSHLSSLQSLIFCIGGQFFHD